MVMINKIHIIAQNYKKRNKANYKPKKKNYL